MESCMVYVLCLIVVLLQVTPIWSHSPPAAVYVIGDGSVATTPKAKLPYGIDLPNGLPTRFTNGLNVADLLDLKYGMTQSPTAEEKTKNETTRVNFAIHSAGILPETAKMLGGNSSLGEQVSSFNLTVHQRLPTNEKILQHLDSSVFLIYIGKNDYIVKYIFDGNHHNGSESDEAENFGQLLANVLQQYLEALHSIGARHIIIFEMEPVGCLPLVTDKLKPNSTTCVDPINTFVAIYNKKLKALEKKLNGKLSGCSILVSKTFEKIVDIMINPDVYEFEEIHSPCCVVAEDGFCIPGSMPCPQRHIALFWDSMHLTETGYRYVVKSTPNFSRGAATRSLGSLLNVALLTTVLLHLI